MDVKGSDCGLRFLFVLSFKPRVFLPLSGRTVFKDKFPRCKNTQILGQN